MAGTNHGRHKVKVQADAKWTVLLFSLCKFGHDRLCVYVYETRITSILQNQSAIKSISVPVQIKLCSLPIMSANPNGQRTRNAKAAL